ncbi:MAG: urease accessory protein UreF [Bacteroides sp.]|nr:urease accessory protein UreF [Bacteroides sp.]MBD5418999.1 urease accessory protein UreF [Bacteroides sp.]
MNITEIMRLLQFTDSTFPVGTFSFSNGLETAGFENIVTDKETLHAFAKSQAVQAAFTDGIAALAAHRAFLSGDYDKIVEADKTLILCKMNDEARQMLKRMGKKLGELAVRLFDSEIAKKWLEDIKNDQTPGTYPVAQGIAFAAAGISEEDLFSSHQYGVVNMVLSAALRCVRVSHYDTQEILYSMSSEVKDLYDRVKVMGVNEMNAFFPELDILASLHEKGNMRMFMN